MITNYEPTVENVCKTFFNMCNHNKLDDAGYCANCKTHPFAKNLEDIENLKSGLNSNRLEISGGILIGKLISFLTEYSKLSIGGHADGIWHGICMEIQDSSGLKTFYANDRFSFAYKICWLSEILFRYLLAKGKTEEEIRSVING